MSFWKNAAFGQSTGRFWVQKAENIVDNMTKIKIGFERTIFLKI
jgi:hypothetical protein